jgi:hypothetical protein
MRKILSLAIATVTIATANATAKSSAAATDEEDPTKICKALTAGVCEGGAVECADVEVGVPPVVIVWKCKYTA